MMTMLVVDVVMPIVVDVVMLVVGELPDDQSGAHFGPSHCHSPSKNVKMREYFPLET